jgi:hypothetical protein
LDTWQQQRGKRKAQQQQLSGECSWCQPAPMNAAVVVQLGQLTAAL